MEEPLDRSVQTLKLENLSLKKKIQKQGGKLERARKHLLSKRLLTEAQDQGTSSVQHEEKMEEPLDRIELEYLRLKENVKSLEMEILSQKKKMKKRAGKLKHARKHLSNDSLLTEAQDQGTSSVQHDEKMEEPLDRIELEYLRLKQNVKSLEMEILSLKKKMKKPAGKPERAWKQLSNDRESLTEAQDQGTSSVQHDEKMEEPLDRIELEYLRLKENVKSLEMEILSLKKKMKKPAGKLERAWKHLSNDRESLTEAQDQGTSSVQHDEKMEEPLDRIELEYLRLKENVKSLEMEILSLKKKMKKPAGKLERAWKHLSNDRESLTEAQDQGTSSVQHDEKMEEPLDRIELEYLRLKENVKSLEMEILSLKKKMKKPAGKLERAWKHLSNDRESLTEAQDQGTSSVQHDEKMEEPLDRIELEYLRLKENVKSLEMEFLSLKKKMKKPAGKLERAWKHLSNDRESLTEAQDQGTSSVQHDEKMEEPLDRIELEYLRLKENVKSLEMEILSLKKKMKKPAGKLERAWKHLSNDRESLTEAQDQGTSSVQHDEKMEEPLDRIELEYLRLKENVKSLEMEILSLKKKMKKPAGKLERAWKQLSNDRESVNDPCAETFCVPQPGLEFTVPLQGGLMVTLTLLTQPPE
ncbi:protein Hook homolog 3-like [Cavia porcellus]|uniref:protein Hook homolog 3-like n=1 Tax=Cavia porcellus TaxID=10141 RepID=UPI002FE2413D